jgi:flavoprotein
MAKTRLDQNGKVVVREKIVINEKNKNTTVGGRLKLGKYKMKVGRSMWRLLRCQDWLL